MGLGLTSSSGTGEDFLPYLAFSATSGEAIIKWKEKEGDEYVSKEKELSWPCKFVFDFEGLKLGWMALTSPPDFKLVKFGEPMPAKPSEKHQQGFSVKLYSKADGVFVFSSSSKTIMPAMDTLFDAYTAGLKTNAGKLPVVEITGTEKIKKTVKIDGKNVDKTFKFPKWSIVSWVARPEALTDKAPEPVKETASSDDDEF